MTPRSPKAKGTAFESAVTRWLRDNGFPGADRQPLRGTRDAGDLALCPGVIGECKAGKAAHNASDAQLVAWLTETEREREHAGADVGLLVVDRFRRPVADSWVVTDSRLLCLLHGGVPTSGAPEPVRLTLASAVRLLRAWGYGDPITATKETP